MNRRERRTAAKAGDRFLAHCNGCPDGSIPHEPGKDPCCVLVVIERDGRKELGICRGCACSVGKCDRCGETGQHWLACPIVGLPESSEGRAVQ